MNNATVTVSVESPLIRPGLKLSAEVSERYAVSTAALLVERAREINSLVILGPPPSVNLVQMPTARATRLSQLERVAANIYTVAKWEAPYSQLTTGAQQRLWEQLRDALELPAGTATAANVAA